MPNAQAARVSDQVKHSEAQLYRRVGMGVGALLGIGIGVALVAASGALEVLSAGTATPLVALGIYAGATLVIGGTAAATGAAVSNSAADRGQDHLGDDEGPIITGETSIHVGPERHVAAHIGSKAACNKHKHSPPDDLEEIVQGSVSVRLGRGKSHAARVGDKGTCGFIIGHGCASVIIGGETVTIGKVGDGDDPEKALFNKIGEYGGYAALVGGAILAIPVAAAGSTLMVGLKAGAMALGKGVLFSQAISRGVNLLPEGRLRDDANTVASFLPLLDHGGKAGGGEGKGGSEGGGSGEGGSGGSGEGTGGGDGAGGGAEGNSDSAAGPTPEPAPVPEPVRAPGAEEASPSDANAPSDRAGAQNESGTGEKGGATEAGGTGESPADAPAPAAEADPTNPIGDSPGGMEGDAPGDDAGGNAESPPRTAPTDEVPPPGGEKPTPDEATSPDETTPPDGDEPDEDKPDEDKPDGEADPDSEQAAKDKAFQERSAAKVKAVRDGLHEDNQGKNIAVSEYTPEPGSTESAGQGDYLPSVSGKRSPSYSDPVGEPRTNPTQKGTGELADKTVRIEDGGERGNEHSGDRSTDSEVKLMEAFKKDLDANPDMRGTLDIFSDPHNPCRSCKGVARWFNGEYQGRARVRIHDPSGDVFDEGGGPPSGPGGGEPSPEGGPPPEGGGDPTQQFGKRPGGADGEAPPDDPGGGTGGPDTTGGGDPTVPVGDSSGGRPDDPAGGGGDASGQGASADAKEWGVTWFNRAALKYVDSPDAVLGRPDGLAWFMPSEDAAGLHSVADVARETGMAPGAAEAYKTGGSLFGLSFPLDGVESRLPVAEDAGFNADGTAEPWANPNWLDGGHTAVRFGEPGEPGGGFLVNPTHEFVTPGGKPVPPGSVLFGLEPDGSWTPIRRF